MQKYAKNYPLFDLIEGLPHIRKPSDIQWRLVLPPEWRSIAISQYHDNPTGRHNGKETTHGKVKTGTGGRR